jgi:uncharacterized coiled-coil DUF342 family protein
MNTETMQTLSQDEMSAKIDELSTKLEEAIKTRDDENREVNNHKGASGRSLGEMRKGELKKIVVAYEHSYKLAIASIATLQQKVDELMTERNELRARVCRYAEEAMHFKSQLET